MTSMHIKSHISKLKKSNILLKSKFNLKTTSRSSKILKQIKGVLEVKYYRNQTLQKFICRF